jgi:hypothetical protein
VGRITELNDQRIVTDRCEVSSAHGGEYEAQNLVLMVGKAAYAAS